MSDPKIMHLQLLVQLPEAEARALLAEVKDHARRDATDGNRDSGLVMVPAEALVEAVLSEAYPTTSACCAYGSWTTEVWNR